MKHEWGKIGRFEICKVCCRLRANAENKPCRGPDRLRQMEEVVSVFGSSNTDTMCPMVETMQTETSRARTALSDTTREK